MAGESLFFFEIGLDIEIQNHHKTIDGSKILVNVKMGNDKYTLVNIYEPTVASRREICYKKTQDWIREGGGK